MRLSSYSILPGLLWVIVSAQEYSLNLRSKLRHDSEGIDIDDYSASSMYLLNMGPDSALSYPRWERVEVLSKIRSMQ